jgi:hypothetical protein
MADFEVKVLAKGNFGPNGLVITHSESTRKIDDEVDGQLEAIWEAKVKDAELNGKLLYNGLSYRLNSYEVSGGKLHLDLGLLEYKVRDGLIAVPKYMTLSEPYWRKGLYSTATVRTADDKYLMVELSGKSMNTNAIDLIGGVVETDPEITNGQGVFKSFLAELEEEAFIHEDDIKSCILKSIMLERRGNIGIYFEVQLKINSQELIKRYSDSELETDIKSVRIFDRAEYLEVLQNHNPNKQLIGKLLQT